ncbi:MAG TPA: ABC transporter ATP-binding protein [Polyangiaceae bacterium]|nr:ABC transporter ATP-binding protein [Polyangiaceae bacterium]
MAATTSERSDRPVIALRNVSKDYVGGGGVVHALRDVDLEIAHGEFVAIVGASGSGKSTLMNILGCLDRPTRGTYELSDIEVGLRVNDARAIVRNRLIGFIFQGFNLLPRTTALENCELPLQYRGVPSRERRRRAIDALAAVGLADRMDHTPSQLSGGQQQRVAIARALVSDPPMLLADEPTGNLDTRTSLEVLALLQRLNRERGITIVLVTHEHDIAACASRVISFRDGRMVSDERHEPLDAAAELAKLPPADAGGGPEQQQDAMVAALHAARKPVPGAVYPMMVLGWLLGSLAGYMYCALILGQRVAWIQVLFAVVTEAWLGARTGRARLGNHPLGSDQRLRVALNYTAGFSALLGIAGWFAMVKVPPHLLERFSSRGGAALFAVTLLAVLFAQALLRYLLLSLFGAVTRPARKEAKT